MWGPASAAQSVGSRRIAHHHLLISCLPRVALHTSPASLPWRCCTDSATYRSQTVIAGGGMMALLQARRCGSAVGRFSQARCTRGAAKAKTEKGGADVIATTSSSPRAQRTTRSAVRGPSSRLPKPLGADEQLEESVGFSHRGNSSRGEAKASMAEEGAGYDEDSCASSLALRKSASVRVISGRSSARRLAAAEERGDAEDMDAINADDGGEFAETLTEDSVCATGEDGFCNFDQLEDDNKKQCGSSDVETRLDGAAEVEEEYGATVARRQRRRSRKTSAAEADTGDLDETDTPSFSASEQRTMDSAAIDEETASRYLAHAFPELAAEYAAAGDGANATPVSDVKTDSAVVAAWRCATCDHVWRSGVFVRCILKNECPRCTANRMTTLAKVRPDLLQLWDSNRNNPFLRPEEVSADSKQSVFWNCPMCRESYAARVKDRVMDKVRCPSCALLRSRSAGELASEESVVLQEWHPLKNGDLRIEQVSPTDTKTKVWWLCAGCGHEWEASLAARLTRWRLRRRGLCPVCHGKGVSELME
ncbi:hypothetical protein CUR178_04276 [Leishmania enriettii]|uniref:Treble clef zinc finger domain-containing protein n=1 Tax=Leishmania enriettii TaxID=5663 RepID=A0A836GI73_LEIEN|nr:hypothetical protein CUR178_04276 [Leishmania enriettii]